jgi:signal transduction histidine kinase
LSTAKELELMALTLIKSSDLLVTQLGEYAKINSQNLMLLQILFGIFNIGVHALMLYLIVKILRPISALTHATSEIKKGNLDVSIRHTGNDELSVLSQSFNSMVNSIKNHIKKQNDLASELEKANEELKYKDKLKDEFINVASHELKSPIQPILGLASLAKKDKIKQEEAWDIILRQARKLEQLANDILDVSRIESGNLSCKMDKVRINDVILDLVSAAKLNPNLSKDVSLETKLDRSIEIVADKVRITQVLTNIISNAVKFTKKGIIMVESHVYSEENKIEIKISDTGSGIPEDLFTNLFDKFVTKKSAVNESQHGTGLGLFISKAIITAHNGQVFVCNNNDGGSTFTIILPIESSSTLNLNN